MSDDPWRGYSHHDFYGNPTTGVDQSGQPTYPNGPPPGTKGGMYPQGYQPPQQGPPPQSPLVAQYAQASPATPDDTLHTQPIAAHHPQGSQTAPAVHRAPAQGGGAPEDQIALAQKYGAMYGVDPNLLLAIGRHETHWGTLGAGRSGYTLGYGATDSGNIGKFAGVENQYANAARTLAAHGVKTLQDIEAGKAKWYASDPAWAKGVESAYQEY